MSPPENASERARERFPHEQYPDDPTKLQPGQSYRRERPDGRVVSVTVLDVRQGNANGRGLITITEES